MTDDNPGDPDVPIPSTHSSYAHIIPDLWRQRYEEHWHIAATAMSRGWTPPPYHEELLSAARQLIDEGREEKYQFAVVMAQAACEVLTEQVMAALIERLEPESLREWVGKAVKHRNDFDVERVRNLYTALTGDQIKMGEGLWQRYAIHVERRHRVVHRGERVSKDEATHSYETARQVIDYLRVVQMNK